MENLSRCHREKSGKRLLPHSTYILQHKNDIVKNNKYAETVVFCFIKPKKRKINNSVCRKSMFFKKSACPQSLSPNPFPWWKAVYALLALHRAEPLGIHARHPCRGWVWGCRPHQARTLAVSRTQSLHDAATPTTDNPHCGYAPNPIFKLYRFIDSL